MKLDVLEELNHLFSKTGEKDNVELFEMLRAVEEENAKLKKDNMRLQKLIKHYKSVIEDKDEEMNDLKIQWKESGNLAEYSLKINKVMEAAERAAEEYVSTNKRIKDKAQKEADALLSEAVQERDKIINNALSEARHLQHLNVITIQQIKKEIKQLLE